MTAAPATDDPDQDAPTTLLRVVDHRIAWLPALLAVLVLALVVLAALAALELHLQLPWGPG